MPRATGTANEAAALKRQQLNNISNHLTSQQNTYKHSANDAARNNNGAVAQPNKRKRREEKLRLRDQRDSNATGAAHQQGNSKKSASSKKRLEDRVTRKDQVQSTLEQETFRERSLDEQNLKKTKLPKRKNKSRSPCKQGRNGLNPEGAADVHDLTVAQENAPVLRKERSANKEPLKSAGDVLENRDSTSSPGTEPVSNKGEVCKAEEFSSSPPSSNGNSSKRSITEVNVEPPEHAQKKQRQSPAQSRSPKQTERSRKTQKTPKKVLPNPYKAPNTFAPVVAIPECKHTYKHWNDDSIPILHSAQFQRYNPATLPNNPSAELRVKALLLLEKPSGFNAEDLGRPKVPKTGPTKVISDVDLYLMVDDKIYVGTEYGLILAAKYLTLAGISDTTPVRFNGIKPAWVKASVERRFVRRVLTSTYDPDAPERENPFPPLPAGDLGLMKGFIVQVYERNLQNERAFGRRLDNNLVGWFDWKDTENMNSPYELWDEDVFTKEQYEASANNPVLNKLPAIMPNLIGVPTLRPTPQPSKLPIATSPPTAAPTKMVVNLATPTHTQAKDNPKVTKEQSTAAVCNTATDLDDRPANVADTEATSGIKSKNESTGILKQEQKRKRSLPEENAKVIAQVADSDERPKKVAKIDTTSETGPSSASPAAIQREKDPKSTLPDDKAQATAQTKDEDKLSETAVEKKATPDTSPSNKSSSSGTSHHSAPGMRALYDNTIEDEVDWDDDEL
ncbi:hypothetical protein BDU57DRAFT_592984 [Ampelomyces quisqualis]|uniref:Uncharacterized protein n=1 Tax=Ampelomyces quisqualis TaxID=50730 RepID=A0A6A5QUC8_AMPQU|nr:hypothetical protein BDU57DRAFT_592984 [Ampelomyces quisqualis]